MFLFLNLKLIGFFLFSLFLTFILVNDLSKKLDVYGGNLCPSVDYGLYDDDDRLATINKRYIFTAGNFKK